MRHLLFALACMAPAAAMAHEGAAAAQNEGASGGQLEMTFLIDTSMDMSLSVADHEAPTCDPGPIQNGSLPAKAWAAYERSRIGLVKEVLTGRPAAPFWCVDEPRNNSVYGQQAASYQHTRPMCCAVGSPDDCKGWTPCYDDHGRNRAGDDAAPNGQAFEEGGFIPAHQDEIRFGVVTFDGSPEKEGNKDFASYGEDGVSVPQSVAQSTVFPGANFESPNLGIRDVTAVNGRLVDNNHGVIGDPNREINSALVEAHNRYVMDEIRRTVPVGRAPVAAALQDLQAHYAGREAGACRQQVMVMILGSYPTDYYGGQPCANDESCGDGTGGLCKVDPTSGEKACKYPEGYPYETSVAQAAGLQALGVKVYAIGVGPQNPALAGFLEDVAAAAGHEAGEGWYWAETAEQMATALNAIRRDNTASREGKTPPLTIRPTEADAAALNNNDTKMWQFSAYGQIPGEGDRVAYGVVNRERFVCGAGAEGNRLRSGGIVGVQETLNSIPGFTRRAFSEDPKDDSIKILSGGGGALFDSIGRPSGALELIVNFLRPVFGLGDEEAADPRMGRAGPVIQGFFGQRGLPNGPESDDRGVRQLGPVLQGKMVSIPRPQAAYGGPGYKAFKADYASRPTVVAVPANDGAVHFFRAYDGRELATFVPNDAWTRLESAGQSPVLDGDLVAEDLPTCRDFDGAGGGSCPLVGTEDVRFRSVLVGTMGRAGAGIYGVDVTEIGTLADNAPLQANAIAPLAQGGFLPWNVTPAEVPQLGLTVSEPTLTQVREGGKARGAIIVGCGAAPDGDYSVDASARGRCLLVLEASSGRIIREFSDRSGLGLSQPITHAMVGAASVWPPEPGAVAKLAYIGDEAGYLWRVDMREKEPSRWTMQRMWPRNGLAGQGYALGSPLESRPVVLTRGDGNPAVVFVTGKALDDPADDPDADPDEVPFSAESGFAVSVSDVRNAVTDTYQSETNWVLPLSEDEYAVGDPVAFGDAIMFTSLAAIEGNQCGSSVGRLYGVKAVEISVDADGNPFDQPLGGGRTTRAVPAIPLGGDLEGALAIQLPPGRVAYGLSMARMPSCNEGPDMEQMILNLADESQGASGDQLATEQMQVQTLDGGGVQARALQGDMFTNATGTNLSVCLNCDAQGVPKVDISIGRPAQGAFPSSVTYWGSSFAD